MIAGPPAQVDAVIARGGARRTSSPGAVNIEVASAPPDDGSDPAANCGRRWPIWRPRPRRFRSSPPPVEDPPATPVFDADYWAANCATRCASARPSPPPAEHTHTFIEISPHPLLTHADQRDPRRRTIHTHQLGTLQRDADDTLTFHTNLNATHTTRPPQTPHLPNRIRPAHHPLAAHPPLDLTRRPRRATRRTPTHCLASASPTPPTAPGFGRAELSPDLLWLGDHCIDDVCVLPGSAYAELALAAATMRSRTEARSQSWMIRELNLDQMMHVTDGTAACHDPHRGRGDVPGRNAHPQCRFGMDQTRHRDGCARWRPIASRSTGGR